MELKKSILLLMISGTICCQTKNRSAQEQYNDVILYSIPCQADYDTWVSVDMILTEMKSIASRHELAAEVSEELLSTYNSKLIVCDSVLKIDVRFVIEFRSISERSKFVGIDSKGYMSSDDLIFSPNYKFLNLLTENVSELDCLTF